MTPNNMTNFKRNLTNHKLVGLPANMGWVAKVVEGVIKNMVLLLLVWLVCLHSHIQVYLFMLSLFG